MGVRKKLSKREDVAKKKKKKKMSDSEQHQRREQRQYILFQREEAQVIAQGLVEELWDLLQGLLASASESVDAVVENFFGGSRSLALKVVVGVLVFLVAVVTYFFYISQDEA